MRSANALASVDVLKFSPGQPGLFDDSVHRESVDRIMARDLERLGTLFFHYGVLGLPIYHIAQLFKGGYNPQVIFTGYAGHNRHQGRASRLPLQP